MTFESQIPARVAKSAVQPLESGVLPFIALSEPTILQVDFLELTKIQRCSKSVYPANVDVSLIFVWCPVNLVRLLSCRLSLFDCF